MTTPNNTPPEEQPELAPAFNIKSSPADPARLFVELLDETQTEGGKWTAQRLTIRNGWIDISHISVQRRRKEILSFPHKFRLVSKMGSLVRQQPDSKAPIWGPACVFPKMMFRRAEWAPARWAVPLAVDEHGVLLMFESIPWKVSFPELAAQWQWWSSDQTLWLPCSLPPKGDQGCTTTIGKSKV